jgi:DNA-binding response OmpR family regulator
MALPVVLVVSDDPSLREEVAYAFPSDVEVVVAEDSLEAVTAMRERQPVAVISEIRTGHEGGFSLGRHMSQDASLSEVPLFLLLERPQDEWLAGQAGAAAWRTLPVDTSELVRVTLELIADPDPVGARTS